MARSFKQEGTRPQSSPELSLPRGVSALSGSIAMRNSRDRAIPTSRLWRMTCSIFILLLLWMGKLEEIFEMGVPTPCYRSKHQSFLKDMTFFIRSNKSLLKMHVYSLFCLKYFWNFSLPVQTEVHITSIYNRGHLHPEIMKQAAQRLTSPALLISGPAAGLQKKKESKNLLEFEY